MRYADTADKLPGDEIPVPVLAPGKWKASLPNLSKKSEVSLAIHYVLGRWTQLVQYSNDGRFEIDNAAVRAFIAGCGPWSEETTSLWDPIPAENAPPPFTA